MKKPEFTYPYQKNTDAAESRTHNLWIAKPVKSPLLYATLRPRAPPSQQFPFMFKTLEKDMFPFILAYQNHVFF